MILKNNPPQGFLDEETRDGYTVSAHMKKVWAVQLDMLQELQRVCEKYGLRFWMEGGSLIGAVRHHGYIPWDDDIDVVMPRADFDKLQEVGPQEFTHPHFFQNFYTDPHYNHRHIQIRNVESAEYNSADLARYCRGIFLDIFPLDYLPNNPRAIRKHEQKLRKMKQRIKFTQKVFRHLPEGWYKHCRDNTKCLSDKWLYAQFEDELRKYKEDRAVVCCPIGYKNYSVVRAVSDYKETVLTKFEWLEVPIPAAYDSMLTAEYGDYMTPVHSATRHGAHTYETDRSYREVFKKVL